MCISAFEARIAYGLNGIQSLSRRTFEPGASYFSPDLGNNRPKLCMSESSARRAFDEFHLTRLLRFGPNTFGHDFRCDCVLMFAFSGTFTKGQFFVFRS